MRPLQASSVILMGLGSLIVALPDSGHRLFSFSGEHGPSFLDALGILLLLSAFGLVLNALVRRRALLAEYLSLNPPWAAVLAFQAGLGTGLLVAGVFTDFWWWWLVGAAILAVFWYALLRITGKAMP